MQKLIYGMNLSLDGYIAAPGDDISWSVPSEPPRNSRRLPYLRGWEHEEGNQGYAGAA